jgi:hypothetical protein
MITILTNKIQTSQVYKRFQISIERRPTLYVDWISLTNRSWYYEPMKDIINNRKLNNIINKKSVEEKLDKVISILDRNISNENCAIVLNCMENISNHSSIYTILDGIEEIINGERMILFENSLDHIITERRIIEILDIIEYIVCNNRFQKSINNLPIFFSGQDFDHFMQFCETHFDNDREEMENFLNSLNILKINLFISMCMKFQIIQKLYLFMSIENKNFSKSMYFFILLMPIFVIEKVLKGNMFYIFR